nr:hypothetical protein KPHV_63460 [Kitasatospora purpeofusca]
MRPQRGAIEEWLCPSGGYRLTWTRLPGRVPPAIPISLPRDGRMTSVECKLARRGRIREILTDIAVGVVSNVLVMALTSVAHLLF